ncbi:hypothetical protein ACLB2K_030010 [Fragaria x ananassa]
MPTNTDQNDIFTELDQQNHEFTDPTSFLSNPNPPPRDDCSCRSFGVSVTSEASGATLQYIREMLMEEELENRPCMLQDFLALQAAEKSLEDVLIQQYPPPTNPLLASSIELSAENSCDFINHSSNSSSAARSWDDGSGEKGGSNGKTTVRKKKDDNREVVDFQSLLTQCAKSVASYDRRTANELLKQIRQHSSPYGDGNQRVAHYLANGLEERLAAAVPSFNPL